MSSTPKLPYFSADKVIESAFTADSSLATSTSRMVTRTATGVALCGTSDNPYGILYNAPASGEYAEVVVSASEMTGVAAAAVSAAGLALKVAANGKLTPASSGDTAIGISTSTAAGDGSLVSFHFMPFKAV